MALTSNNRLVPEPIGIDATRDSVYSDFPGSSTGAVSVLPFVDANGNRFMFVINISGTSINPNADTTYDAAPVNSIFINGVGNSGSQFYVKTSATAWTAL